MYPQNTNEVTQIAINRFTSATDMSCKHQLVTLHAKLQRSVL